MLDKLATERRNERTMHLDEMSIEERLTIMNEEDQKVPQVIQEQLPVITQVVERVIASFRKGGRLIYIGAGTSGRLGILDAAECVPTFGVSPNQVIGLIAGGERALASISCNRDAVISRHADYPIEVETGPEVLTGSTRLKAGTAQKLVLNMISTTSMIGVGKVYQNLMVDVQPTNEKLEVRAKRMIAEATGVDMETAARYFVSSKGHVKTVIVMILADVSYEEAVKRLERANGFVREAL